ncbi:MAG: hypothetical protein ACK56W_07440 [Pirellula sp.]|jgi:hypothetical protein
MKLSDDTLICLGEILAGKEDPHNREIYKLQHNYVRGLILHEWYFLFTSRVRASGETPFHIAIDETTFVDASHAEKSSTSSFISLRIHGNQAERIIAVPLSGRQPIASIVEKWGDPPQIVLDDWRLQLNDLSGQQEILFFLASEDGLLSKVPGIEGLEVGAVEAPDQLDHSWKIVEWPWERGHANLSPIRKQLPKKRASNQRGPLLLMGGSFTGIIVLIILYAIFWPPSDRSANSSNNSQADSVAIAVAPAKDDIDAASTHHRETQTTTNQATETVDLESLEKIDLTNGAMHDKEELLVLSQDFSRLLEQGTLGDSILSNKIVESSLSSSREMTLNEVMESESTGTTDAPDSETPAPNEPEVDKQNEAPSHLNLDTGIERTLLLSDSTIKDRFAIGQKLLSKEGKCRATLHVQTEDSKSVASVVPEGNQSIIGNGTISWTIGIEDSDPELVVQLQSKPGRRWDLVVLIGFREEKTQTPRLLAPGKAKNVVHQLIAAKQSLLRLLEQNQIARDSGVRSSVDLYDQRRQLQRHEKELDKALERWKVIETLSYLVFDQTKLHIKLERSPPNQADL